MNFQNYIISSKDYFYNIVLIFPFLLSYEILGLIINFNFPFEIRNGADVLLRQTFLYFGEYGKIILLLTIIIFSIMIFFKGKTYLDDNDFNTHYLFFMIFEGLFFGILLFLIFSNIPNLLIVGKNEIGIFEKLYLAIGAGIFEELIFRLLLIGFTSFLICKIFNINYSSVFIPALILSSFLFSGFHYIGNYGDNFNWESFLLRFSAGGYLGTLFYFRGFGICVISHIFYDFIVIQRINY